MSAKEHPQPVPAQPSRSRLRIVAIAGVVIAMVIAGVASAVLLADTGSDPSAAPPDVGPTTGTGSGSFPIGTLPGVNGDAMRDALDALKPASIAFNTPSELRLDEQEAVRLLVSRDKTIEELQAQIDDAIGDKEGATIKVSDVMIASLTGLDFDIERTSDARQPVLSRGETMWGWSVEPTEPGTQSLHLTLTALLDVNGKEETYTVKTFDRTWTVVVPWPDRVTGFAGENWQWLWTAIFFPLAAIVWRRLRTRQRGGERPVAHG
jgi:hypothetical protein